MAGLYPRLRDLIADQRRFGVATRIDAEGLGRKALVLAGGEAFEGDLGLDPAAAASAFERCRALLAEGNTRAFPVDEAVAEGPEIFFEIHEPPPRLVVVGAVHVAIPLVAIAKAMGFETVVVDARTAYATKERFGHADELVVRWPGDALAEMTLHGSTYCVFLTHDEKLDNPGLVVALRSEARYVGALGSKRTHAKRAASLRELGLSDEEIDRIHAPIGIKLGGNRPEEIAVSIAAEMVAARHGRA
ncbi:MAG: XdhC family protein [Thermoanaerobaculia bacterium]|nr:XdhC family protein [Thermoanaerobaculia bacterium]